VLPMQIGGDPADPLKVIVVRYVGPQGRIVERPTSL